MPLRLLFDPRVRRGFLIGWWLGWLAVAALMLRPPPEALAAVSDKLLHFIGYLVMTGATVSFCRSPLGLLRWSLVTLALATALELGQALMPGRSFELHDLFANAAGVAVGYLLAVACLMGLLRPLAVAFDRA
ncbi:MAG TPA: VanZ family protein [Geminicoccaceae bacterium]|nr:VanZ family protein [Geminicoccaceae bacterium]